MSRPLLAAAVLCAAAGAASAQHGLQWGAPVADRSTRLVLAGWTIGLRVHLLDDRLGPLRLIGDHYLTGPGFGAADVGGGLRVSGGLAIDGWRGRGTGGLALASPAPAMAGLSAGERAGWAVQPYLGIGYSLSARAGWGFAADIGLGGRRAGPGLRLAPAGQGNAVERVLDDLRLAPVLQLGVSHAF